MQRTIMLCFIFFITGCCSSKDKFLPETLPTAKVGELYSTKITLPPGQSVFCESMYISIEPVNSGLIAEYKDPAGHATFCASVIIHGIPKTTNPISVNLYGEGPMAGGGGLGAILSHTVHVDQNYIIKVE
ncbi:hypothetical protein JAF85_004871 [Citrobacter werkmanii]|nr:MULTISPECIES: hypothetical protein [Citrobacter]EGT0638812.1 hypothetical protein [Citrobacter werkmanii]EGT0674044.1 hypothetical protein [Citrobacter werkmanii]MDT0638499.1 hypothetical protein [Citrobacter werkmanii]TKU68145.1 hypothetical protein FDX14_24280 [Citrobacter sp. wls710]TKU74056.1 hypothetical protein FDW92_15375 [Citrobacter sp. wls706]